VLEIDQDWRGGRTGPLCAFDPSRRLRPVYPDQFSEARAAEEGYNAGSSGTLPGL
jgi:hypothetical protein